MYSSRRKSNRSYRKRVVSRKNKTRSKRKNLKFRKMRGGALSYEEFRNKYAELVDKQSQSSLFKNQNKSSEYFKNEIDELIKENQDNYKKMLEEIHNKDENM